MKSGRDIVLEVISGKWGNGEERIKRLTAAGYNAIEIQDMVNDYIRLGYVPNYPTDNQEKEKERLPFELGNETLTVKVNLSKYNSIKLEFEI